MSEHSLVLVISHDVAGAQRAGPGIRYRQLARVLAQHFAVSLAVPHDLPPLPTPARQGDLQVWPYTPGQWDTLAPAAEKAKVILLCGDTLGQFPALEQSGIPLVVDGYDPHPLETLEMFAGTPEQASRHREREEILQTQCRAGDFFICASQRQRDWWLGLLEANGRVNVQTYGQDPTLRQLVDVVPFGLPGSPPRHTRQVLKGVWPGIEPGDKVVLWGGGLWQWLDPLTAIRALAQIRQRRADVKLVFPGTRHPNPGLPDMPMRQAAIHLAEELELVDRGVFFGDWVPYEDWPNVLLESDLGLSLHFDTLETRLAFRSRVLDYVWASLPIVATHGDATGEMVEAYGLGTVVDYSDVPGVAEAILALLDEPHGARQERFAAAQADLTWERAARPLVAFCHQPRRAADRRPHQSIEKTMSPSSQSTLDVVELRRQVESLEWYHTLDLGNGIVTPGDYDHRPYLDYYGIPASLAGKTALDVGAASGFFSFEMEQRGAQVTALDLPAWHDHDFGPRYTPDKTAEEGRRYLRDPIRLARQALASKIEKVERSVYDMSPETVGMYDLVFCGSMLLHLTDPIKALWQIQRVTREVAIIATVVNPDSSPEPLALYVGHHRGDGWWFPNRACLEAMVQSAGFAGWEWFSEFRLDYRDGQAGPYHGVVRAWNTPEKPDLPPVQFPPRPSAPERDDLAGLALAERDAEIARLQALVSGYERGRFIRLAKWLHGLLQGGRV
ncbi:MAG: hypothetical protein JW850_09105 [Thermoflexales bacterium]|nr:hypothetical protein [Thermoflexales bacterium]